MRLNDNVIRRLKEHFSSQAIIRSPELFAFFRQNDPSLKPGSFRWRVHELKRRGVLTAVGRGFYSFKATNRYSPAVSSGLKQLSHQIKAKLPFAAHCVWSTAWLSDFMLHQPTVSMTIVEVEKDAAEAAFLYLREQGKRAYLEPSPTEVERYILHDKNALVVKKMIDESPLHSHGAEVPVPRLEKLLVDLLCDKEFFFAYQGQELLGIFESAFDRFSLNLSTMKRYAMRRGMGEELVAFLKRIDKAADLVKTIGFNKND